MFLDVCVCVFMPRQKTEPRTADKTLILRKDFWPFDLQMQVQFAIWCISFAFTILSPSNTQLCKCHEMEMTAHKLCDSIFRKKHSWLFPVLEKIHRIPLHCARYLKRKFIASLLILSMEITKIFTRFSKFKVLIFCLLTLNNTLTKFTRDFLNAACSEHVVADAQHISRTRLRPRTKQVLNQYVFRME